MAKLKPVRVLALCVGASFLFLDSTDSESAEKKTISGKLSKRGYTVIALDSGGEAKSVLARRGKFKLRPTELRVTLHLRAPDGTYAGPIVVRSAGGGKGKTATSSRRKGAKNQVIVG